MKLITKEIEKLAGKYPLYSQDSKGDEALVWLKFFDPAGRFTYLVTEMEIDKIGDRTAGIMQEHAPHQYLEGTIFGYCISPLGPDCDELGYFDLSELSTLIGRFGLGIERDMHFKPCTLKEAKEQY